MKDCLATRKIVVETVYVRPDSDLQTGVTSVNRYRLTVTLGAQWIYRIRNRSMLESMARLEGKHWEVPN